ncbi:hypothetical protein [Streptomyces drozdowiczii]
MAERTRINVTNHYGELTGHFILESAKLFQESTKSVDDFTQVSVNTGSERLHETLYRTAGGQWVIANWSDFADSTTDYRFIDDEQAKSWLLLNEEDAAVEKYFGELEEEAGPNLGGRPQIGPKVETRLPADVLAKVDARAASQSIPRADVLRQLIERGLAV